MFSWQKNARTILLQEILDVLEVGYEGDIIGEATPDVIVSEFVRYLSSPLCTSQNFLSSISRVMDE